MRIQAGSVVSSMSGKLGGHYAQTGPSGLSLRSTIKPKESTRTGAGIARQLQLTISRRWAKLTETQRSRYSVKAPFWKTQFRKNLKLEPDGFAFFKLIASRAIRMGLPVTNNPTLPSPTPPLSAISLLVDVSSSLVQVTQSNTTGLNEWTFIFMSRPFPSHLSPEHESVSLITVRQGNGADSFNLFSAYTARFGLFKAGQRIRYSIYAVRSTSMARSKIFTGTAVVVP